jgi:hypothetical protein
LAQIGNTSRMSEWRELTERLVKLDFAIEDLDAWASAAEDVEQLARLEAVRDELQTALAEHHVSRRVRQLLDEDGVRMPQPRLTLATRTS